MLTNERNSKMTNQPDWKCIAQIGDNNPLEYGGHWILQDNTQVYDEESEILLVDDDGQKTTYTVYRYSLDKLKLVNGYIVPAKYNVSWPHSLASYQEWFVKDIQSIAEFIGMTAYKLKKLLIANDPVCRAIAYEAIGQYLGYENLDSYPLILTENEVKERYNKPVYKIAKG
jgi:hypothetical protein